MITLVLVNFFFFNQTYRRGIIAGDRLGLTSLKSPKKEYTNIGIDYRTVSSMSQSLMVFFKTTYGNIYKVYGEGP